MEDDNNITDVNERAMREFYGEKDEEKNVDPIPGLEEKNRLLEERVRSLEELLTPSTALAIREEQTLAHSGQSTLRKTDEIVKEVPYFVGNFAWNIIKGCRLHYPIVGAFPKKAQEKIADALDEDATHYTYANATVESLSVSAYASYMGYLSPGQNMSPADTAIGAGICVALLSVIYSCIRVGAVGDNRPVASPVFYFPYKLGEVICNATKRSYEGVRGALSASKERVHKRLGPKT